MILVDERKSAHDGGDDEFDSDNDDEDDEILDGKQTSTSMHDDYLIEHHEIIHGSGDVHENDAHENRK